MHRKNKRKKTQEGKYQINHPKSNVYLLARQRNKNKAKRLVCFILSSNDEQCGKALDDVT